MFKRISFIALSLLSASTCYANHPHDSCKYEFDLTAVFLKAGASNMNYVINNQELPAQSPNWTEQEIQPGFRPGFELGARYIFPHHTYVSVDWTNLYNSSVASINADGVNYFLGPDYEIGPGGLVIRAANGNAKFWYNVVNIDLGKEVQLDCNVSVRFFGGLSGGSLEQKVTSNYYGNRTTTYPGPFSMQQLVKSQFTGLGPRFGARAKFTTRNGFAFWGEAAASSLIGYIASTSSYTGTSRELITLYGQAVNYQSITDQHVFQVIPGFETKLAVQYGHDFMHYGRLVVSLGWQAAVYINAISQYVPQSLVSGTGIETGGIFVSTMAHRISNYSVQGPFLKFVFMV